MALDIKLPDSDAFAGARTITLPSGKTAAIRSGFGRDLRRAQQAAGTDAGAFMFALLAMLVQIDGRAIAMEDLDEMSLADVMALQTEAAPNFPEPASTPAASPPSSSSASPPRS